MKCFFFTNTELLNNNMFHSVENNRDTSSAMMWNISISNRYITERFFLVHFFFSYDKLNFAQKLMMNHLKPAVYASRIVPLHSMFIYKSKYYKSLDLFILSFQNGHFVMNCILCYVFFFANKYAVNMHGRAVQDTIWYRI